MRARARRRAFAFGSFARNGLIGARPGVTLAFRTGVGAPAPLSGRGEIAGRGADGAPLAGADGGALGPAAAPRGEKTTGRCAGALGAAGGAVLAPPARGGCAKTPAGGVRGRGMAGA